MGIIAIIQMVITFLQMILSWFEKNTPGPKQREAMARLRGYTTRLHAKFDQFGIAPLIESEAVSEGDIEDPFDTASC